MDYMKQWAIMLFAIGIAASSGRAQPNPYCVTGADWRANGRMIKLGMPGGLNDESGSLGYFWGQFSAYNIAAMTNPSYRWTTFGYTPPFHSYDIDTDSIHDPVATQNWVLANPGKVYLLGNEPNNGDLAAGDGMTPAQYAQFYHRYYEFIRPLDPTARFAVGGCFADAYSLNNNIEYWTGVLNEYRTRYGMEMPIDIWNNHYYEAVGRLDPDHIINDFFFPFRQFVDTVAGGIHAGKEIWCTEFGVAMWSAPLAPDYMAEFVRQLCPRLEASGAVDRFFWFLGPWEYTWRDSALLDQQGQPTVIGAAYSQLANSFPNPLPPPPSDPPPPVARVSSDFAIDASPWRVMGGDWAIDNGACRQTRMDGAWGRRTHLPYWYSDLRIECDVKINAANDPNNWAGVNIRGGTIWKEGRTRAYLVFLRQNGELGLNNKIDGTVVTVPGAVADTSVYHRLAVSAVGWHFEVSIDDNVLITWVDTNEHYAAGLVSIEAGKTDCSFDNVVVAAYMPSDFDRDLDVDVSDFSFFQACYNGPNRTPNLPECGPTDLDDDGDADLTDFALFQSCFNGPNRPPACSA
jgi:hypothetical protein